MSEINQTLYKIELDDPAVPSFCSFPKAFYGDLNDIAMAIECMERKGVCTDTADAFASYQEGDLEAEHYVCYNKSKLLLPVELIAQEQFEIDELQWDHLNAWECTYKMRASHISVTQAVFKDGENYCRCIRPQFADLQYNGRWHGEWIDIDRFWGNTGTVEACGNKCWLTLFVQEEWGTDLDATLSNMGDETKLDFRRACDEIFGNV